jgi:hypothetical protein
MLMEANAGNFYAGFFEDLPERLTTDGSSGSAPRNGDLIYYKPWGNLGLYHHADGGHDDNVIPIGVVESGMEQLNRLERGQVTSG